MALHIVDAPDVPRGEVYLLGAGFSKAVYPGMPLTNGLGTRVVTRLAASGGRRDDLPSFSDDGLTFESWLSWLGETQPFDSAADALGRRERFLRLQEAIAAEVVAAECDAARGGVPDWVFAFYQLVQLGLATVVTFNYDQILERNLPSLLTDPDGEIVQVRDVVSPLFTEQTALFAGSEPSPRNVNAFDYLKLHGSVDWWVYPDDPSGGSLQQGDATESLPRALQRLRGSRQRFIVPPTAQKSSFYGSQLIGFLWRQAASALRSATRLSIIGYSLPLTDISTASLLAATVAASDIPVDVIDIDPATVTRHLAALGCNTGRVTQHSGPAPAEAYVHQRCHEIGLAFAGRFRLHEFAGRPLAFAWNRNVGGQVERIRLERGARDLVLIASAVGPVDFVRPDAALLQERPRAISSTALPDLGTVERVFLEADGRRWLAGGFIRGVAASGPDDGSWVVMYPLGVPPHI